MHHEMKLQTGPFTSIKSGTKTIESRLFDEKRQLIKLGDTITFRNAKDLDDTITVEVTDLLRYPTFSALFVDFPPAVFGGESIKDLENAIYAIYTKEDEKKYSVLGICIKLMG